MADELKELQNMIKNRIEWEKTINRVAYISSERIRAYKRVLEDIKKLKRLREKGVDYGTSMETTSY